MEKERDRNVNEEETKTIKHRQIKTNRKELFKEIDRKINEEETKDRQKDQ
jgi:hypothetical protein